MQRVRLVLATALVAAAVAAGAQEPAASPSPPPAEREARFDAQRLRELPRSPDPWSLLRRVPGVLVDRADVGGSELGQQSLVVSHGDAGGGTTWTIDGFDVTDPAAVGFTTVFPDLALVDSVSVRSAASDVRVRTPGAQVAIALPEPREAFALGLAARGTGEALQWSNTPEELTSRPFPRPQTDRLFEWSGAAGGPVGGDRLNLWGAASQQELKQQTATAHDETLRLTSFIAKASLRLGNGRLTWLGLRNEKVHEDRDPTTYAASDARWRQSGPTHLLGLTDARTIAHADVVTRLLWLDSGFELEPAGGSEITAFEDFRGIFQRSYLGFATDRPRREAAVSVGRGLRLFGHEHRFEAGLGYARSTVETRSSWPGDGSVGFERRNVFTQTFRLTGLAQLTRAQDARTTQDRASVWLSDSFRLGHFSLQLGARLDRQAGHDLASSAEANALRPDLLPGVNFAGSSSRFRWLDVLPRAAAAWDPAGDGRLVVRAGYAAYGAALSAGDVAFDNPLGQVASLTWWWRDGDGDRAVDADELDLSRAPPGALGLDPSHPGAAQGLNAIDPDLASPRTHDFRIGLETRLGERWEARVESSWRRLVNPLWRPLRELSSADYALAGVVAGELFGESYSIGAYAPVTTASVEPTRGRVLTNRHGYAQDHLAVELEARGRFGTWGSLQAWVAFQDWRELFQDRAFAVQDPTPLDIEPLLEAGALAARPGGLGRGDIFVNARWSGGLEIRAGLPAEIETGATLSVREGFPIPYYEVAPTGDPTGSAKNVLVAPRLDRYRASGLALLDLRLERGFRAGRGTLTPTLEIANALNRATTLQVSRDVTLPRFGSPRELLRPRSLLLGVGFRF